MDYTVTSGEALSPVRLKAMGQNFDRLSRTVGKFVALTREGMHSNGMPGMKEIGPIGDAKNPTPSGAIIESWTDTSDQQGGDTVNMPVLGFLSKPPLGDTEAEGLGETIPIYNRQVQLAMFRKPMKHMTKMNVQLTPKAIVNAVNNIRSFLYDYWDRYQEGNLQHTLCTGYDVMLTNYRPITGQKTSNTPFSPPNLHVAGAGKVSYTEAGSGLPGTAAYETTVKDKLATLIDSPTKGLTPELVLVAQRQALRWNIPQMKTPWGDFTIWIVDDWQHLQLTTHEDYETDYQMAGERGKNNPLFTQASTYWRGNLFFVVHGGFGVKHDSGGIVTAANAAFGGTSSLGMPQYGPDNFWISSGGTADGLDTNDIKLAHIVGPGALHKLLGRDRYIFEQETGDFKRRHETVLESYVGYVRGDIFDPRDEDGNGADSFKKNESHYCVATWSPAPTNI